LIRHGETAWSISGQHSGRTDLPLTAAGEDEARALAGVLAGRTFTKVLCSPLQRARRTCELAGYSAVAEIDPAVQEWDYGECTSFTEEQIRERFPGWTIWSGPVPDGESIEQIAARATGVVNRIRAMSGTVAVFAHGHFLRIFATQWLGLAPQAGCHLSLDTSAVCILGEDVGFPAIRAWNLKRL